MGAASGGSPVKSTRTSYIVSLKPAPGNDGPTLVSDDPAVVRAVLDAIRQSYAPPATIHAIDRSLEGES